MTFGTDPEHWLRNTDPDPAFFVSGWQDAYYFLKLHFHQFSQIKVKKKTQIPVVEIKVSLIFCLFVDERIRIRTKYDGSGSGRPKNLRIRIHNTTTLQYRIVFVFVLPLPPHPPPPFPYFYSVSVPTLQVTIFFEAVFALENRRGGLSQYPAVCEYTSYVQLNTGIFLFRLLTEILIKFLKAFVHFLVCSPKMGLCFLFYHKVGGI